MTIVALPRDDIADPDVGSIFRMVCAPVVRDHEIVPVSGKGSRFSSVYT